MPWRVESDSSKCPASKPYAVVKESDGELVGCHESESSAQSQMRALYASEKD